MEKVKIKVWKVRVKVPIRIPKNYNGEKVETIDWIFKLMMN